MSQVSLSSLKYLTIAVSTALLVGCGSGSSSDPDPIEAEAEVPEEDDLVVVPPPIEVEEIVPVIPDPISASFENNFQGWLDALTSEAVTVDFESIPSLSRVRVNGDEFSALDGEPRLTQTEGTGMFVGNPSDGNQIISPVSGINTFFMGCDPNCEGVVRVDFSSPVNSFGAYFVDVEADFGSTGFSLFENAIVPEFAFSEAQGQNAQSHLGFTRSIPFSTVFIHFSTGSTNDGAAMDDMSYVLSQSAP